ncbi:MAG TPA: hypothetical protein VG942_19365, partial [Hyphomonadaceae bacterium]|nr:hypothetical protein [Hyphomonadaceae bacterium]
KVTSVQWDSPAFRAGLTTATTIAGVNGEVYSADKLRAAVGATKGNGPKVELLVKIGDEYRSIKLDYNGGNRYPRLERIPGKPALIDDIYKTK